jgi:hypothetical protein
MLGKILMVLVPSIGIGLAAAYVSNIGTTENTVQNQPVQTIPSVSPSPATTKIKETPATAQSSATDKKLLEDAEKNSFDKMAEDANDKINMLGAEINAINGDATDEMTEMYRQSKINPLDTGFIKGRSFLIEQKKNQRRREVYRKQIEILETLLKHPYASKTLGSKAWQSRLTSLKQVINE